MLFRFTLSNDIEGAHVISDPDGWKEIKLKLDRDPEFHSLVEIIEVPIIFYRSSDLVDGGYDYIRNIEDTQGIDAQIEILIEVSEDEGTTYETFFEGLLELETIKDISDAEAYKLECNIVRNDFWSKFINRKNQQVNLNSSVSLDGDALTPISDINLYLPSQKIRQIYYAQVAEFETASYQTVPNNDYGQIDFPRENISEIKEKFTYSLVENPNRPLELFAMALAGEYAFDILLYTATSVILGSGTSNNVDAIIQKNDETPIILTRTGGSSGLESWTEHRYNGTMTLAKGDLIRLYFQNVSGGSYSWVLFAGLFHDSYMRVTGDTTFESSQTDSFLLRDAAESALSKIIGRDNVLFSDYLGDETPTSCASNFAIMKGLHVRGYSMSDKPMFMSFDDWWDGANPIFNLGLGYETILGTEYIRIENKSYFYDESISLTLDNVEKITRVYDKSRIFKSVEIGYQKWSAESSSGVDDPQTKHQYNTRFKIIGKDERVLSKFFAASLGIEQTRRNRVEFGKDWRLDEDTIIIAINRDSTPYQPELDEEFSSIVNLLNSNSRYNIRLTPARNFERWKPYFNGCLQTYVNNTPCEFYKFASGEGNFDTETTGDGSCDGGTLSENQDICVTDDYYHTHAQYEFEKEMTFQDYKVLRDNRKNAIAVSPTTTNHKVCFINEFEYDHYNAVGRFRVWVKDTDFNF